MAYFRSDAALQLLAIIGFAPTLASVLRLVPRWLRDGVYDYVARNRFRFFGRRDACYLPSPADTDRFLT